jgi:DNA-directed RNA polymerase specialized sigma subunit
MVDRRDLIDAILSHVPQRSAMIIRRRFVDGLLLNDLATELGVTRSRAGQISSASMLRATKALKFVK